MAGSTPCARLPSEATGPRREFDVIASGVFRSDRLTTHQLHITTEHRGTCCSAGIRDLAGDQNGELGAGGICNSLIIALQSLRHLDDACRVVVGQ